MKSTNNFFANHPVFSLWLGSCLLAVALGAWPQAYLTHNMISNLTGKPDLLMQEYIYIVFNIIYIYIYIGAQQVVLLALKGRLTLPTVITTLLFSINAIWVVAFLLGIVCVFIVHPSLLIAKLFIADPGEDIEHIRSSTFYLAIFIHFVIFATPAIYLIRTFWKNTKVTHAN